MNTIINLGVIGYEDIYDGFKYDKNNKPYKTNVKNEMELTYNFKTNTHTLSFKWVMMTINLDSLKVNHR